MTGPQFLLLYAALAIVANVGLRWHFRRCEAAKAGHTFTLSQDPYQIAFLRGGASEAVKVAVVSLVDRKLLRAGEGTICIAVPDADAFGRRTLEQAILERARQALSPAALLADGAVQAACLEYEASLSVRGLLADARTHAARSTPLAVMVLVMVGIAVLRIGNALVHGRHNVGFLVVLTVVTVVAMVPAYRDRLTGLGREALAKLRTLFRSLKARAASIAPGGATSDAVLLAAVFGLAALPAHAFPCVQQLYPRSRTGGGDGDSGSGSSSDGGGCGGGGCGGGCGG